MSQHVATDHIPESGDRGRSLRAGWLLAAAVIVIVVLGVALAMGWDVPPWLHAVWRSFASVSPVYVVPALALQTLSVAFSALAWYGILRYAYPGEVAYLGVLAACAAGSALNSVMPASGGTLVSVCMFVAIIPAATLTGVLAAAAVEKVFYGAMGVLLAVYLFVAVGGSFHREFGFISAHPWAVALGVAGAAAVVVVAATLGWHRLRRLWDEARQGGRILSDRRAYLTQVALPQLASWLSKIGVTALLLAAYGIPVGVHTVFSVIAGNSLATSASLTPGGAGVTQAFNVASLHDATSAANAGAYSVGQQLLITVWNIVLALVLVALAFGRSEGRRLFKQSYAEARHANGGENARQVPPGG